jgi:superfamily II DNA or RNA helicase
VHQTQAVEALIAHEDGILCAPTDFGKTAVAVRLIAARNVPPSSWFTANN